MIGLTPALEAGPQALNFWLSLFVILRNLQFSSEVRLQFLQVNHRSLQFSTIQVCALLLRCVHAPILFSWPAQMTQPFGEQVQLFSGCQIYVLGATKEGWFPGPIVFWMVVKLQKARTHHFHNVSGTWLHLQLLKYCLGESSLWLARRQVGLVGPSFVMWLFSYIDNLSSIEIMSVL